VTAKERWLYFDLGAQDVYQANGRMPKLVRRVHDGAQPLMTTAVWGGTHLDMGWFDDVDVWVDLEACRRLGVEVIRRPLYGGGTAFYDNGCACMWSWMLPKATHPDLDTESGRFKPIMEDVLVRLGLKDVAFEGSMDLRWNGRKLGAMPGQDVVLCNTVGGFINLKRPNLDLYLQVGRVPEDKFRDKLVKDMRDYVVSADEIRGRPLSYEEFAATLVASCRDAGMDLETATETIEVSAEKVRARIASDEHLRRISSARFQAQAPELSRVGFANHKGRKLCRAGVAIDADGTIVAAMMAGDMHVSPPDVIDRVAAALVGAAGRDASELRRRIGAVFDDDSVHQSNTVLGVTTDDLLAAVTGAVAQALAAQPQHAGAIDQ
jgi:lipoate---protein ligase